MKDVLGSQLVSETNRLMRTSRNSPFRDSLDASAEVHAIPTQSFIGTVTNSSADPLSQVQ